ncbi:MAG: hypothetical protein WAZ27_03035 [Minisyncoccia bacterium]
MSRDFSLVNDRSLVTMLSAEAIELGRMKADPRNSSTDQAEKFQRVAALEKELINRLKVPLIV